AASNSSNVHRVDTSKAESETEGGQKSIRRQRGVECRNGWTEEQEGILIAYFIDPSHYDQYFRADKSKGKRKQQSKTDTQSVLTKMISDKTGVVKTNAAIKAKLAEMHRQFKYADAEYKSADKGNVDLQKLSRLVNSICHFYFVVQDVWGSAKDQVP
ncbi:hypothetical protein BGX26_009234, partial [Mortierella sp. AD094]